MMKPMKVRKKSELHSRYGIVCSNLQECQTKGCKKLGVQEEELSCITLQDGTEVDDEYFQTLPANTVLVFKTLSDTPDKMAEQVSKILSTVTMDKNIANSLIEKAEHIPPSTLKTLLLNIAQCSKSNHAAELRSEDPSWFRGMERRFASKSKWMEFSAMNRVRSYFREAKDAWSKADFNTPQHEALTEIRLLWERKLKEKEFLKYYFSRINQQEYTFCNKDGWFECEGEYSLDNCPEQHMINPYSSYQERAVFSTWNMDHQIEKARTVLPEMVNLIKSGRDGEVCWDYFFKLLFERENLRLVHIACHDKKEHTSAQLDENKYLKNSLRAL